MANLWDKNNLQLTADEQQQILPFLLMGSQAQGPQMSFAQPLDQTMSVSEPPSISPAVQPVVPESGALTPPPTQQDLSMGAAGAAPKEQPSDYSSQLAQAYESAMQAQRASVGDAEARLKQAMQQKEQMNLAPLAQLVDAWTGSRFAPMYQAPESKAKQVQQLQDAVLRARLGVSQTELERLKTLQDQKEKELARQSAERIAGLRLSAAGESTIQKGDIAQEKLQTEAEKDYEKNYGQSLAGVAKITKTAVELRNLIAAKGDPYAGSTAKEIESLASKLAVDYNRDVAQLGALAGADLQLIQLATGQGVGVQEYIKRQFMGGAETRKKLLDMMIQDAKDAVERAKGKVETQSNFARVEKKLNNDLGVFNKALEAKSQGQKKYTREELENLKKNDPEKFRQVIEGK